MVIMLQEFTPITSANRRLLSTQPSFVRPSRRLCCRLTPSTKLNAFRAFNPATYGLTNLQGVAIEAIFAFNLIFVAVSCLDTKNRPNPAAMPSLAIGFSIGVGIMAAVSHAPTINVTGVREYLSVQLITIGLCAVVN